MPSITKKGYELAAKLAPALGYTNMITETCSLICRSAVTLHRLNEESCNGHPCQQSPYIDSATASKLQDRWDARIDRETDRVTLHLEALVWSLPEVDDLGHFGFSAETDPRGCSLIIAPEGSGIRGDSWGDSNGICIPR